MLALTREQFAWIVGQRATYVLPTTIVLEYRREFKDAPPITLADVALAERNKLPPDWQEHFDAERENFLNAPTADKRVRIAELDKMFKEARDRKAVTIAADLLEQIAKEQADAYAPKGNSGKSDVPGDIPEIIAITRTVIDPAAPVPQVAE